MLSTYLLSSNFAKETTMKSKARQIAALGIAVAILTPFSAHAADWIEAVSLQKNGIDVVPIEVQSNGSEYTNTKTKSHKFTVEMYARAKSGKRIVAAALGTSNATNYFEADGGHWTKRFNGRDVANGSLRTWQLEYVANVPASKINWVGQSPIERCNALLASKRANGSSRFAVLNQIQTTSATAYFKLNAVAAWKNRAKNNSWSIGTSTNQSASMNYTVQVKCLPSSTVGNKINN